MGVRAHFGPPPGGAAQAEGVPWTHTDALVAAGACALNVLSYVFFGDPTGEHQVSVAGLLLIAVAALPLLFRRSHPLPVLAVVVLLDVLSTLLLRLPTHFGAALIVSVYSVARACPRRVTAAAAVTAAALLSWSQAYGRTVSWQEGISPVLSVLFVVGGALAVNRWQREVAANRQLLADRAVADERRRIARELHDIVAHHITTMQLMAGGARANLANPEVARDALVTLESSGRLALREMRQLLNVLRTGDEPDDAPSAPQPGVEDLDRLVAESDRAGLPTVPARSRTSRRRTARRRTARCRTGRRSASPAGPAGQPGTTVEGGGPRAGAELARALAGGGPLGLRLLPARLPARPGRPAPARLAHRRPGPGARHSRRYRRAASRRTLDRAAVRGGPGRPTRRTGVPATAPGPPGRAHRLRDTCSTRTARATRTTRTARTACTNGRKPIMTATAQPSGELNWLLDDLVGRVAALRHAVILSSDGLATGASQGLGREDAEHLAAVAAGFHSLAKGAGRHFQVGGVRQTMVELDEAFLFITAAGDGSCLAVLSEAESDVGQIAYEMALLVKRVGEHLSAEPRTDSAVPPPGR
ncbi:hypothetical protein GCM10020229_26400 [Kitasatospora albolonga]